jgi:hypothetical protein
MESKEVKAMKPVRKNGSRVKRVFDKTMTQIAEGKKPVVSKIMLEEGYSESAAACVKVLRTATWKQLKEALPKNEIMQVFADLINEKNDDKRTRLAAAIELCKLNDLYPTKKLKIETLNEKNDEFLE